MRPVNLLAAMLLAAGLAACTPSFHETPKSMQPTSTPTQPATPLVDVPCKSATNPVKYCALLEYLDSKPRNLRLNAAIQAAGSQVARALEAGKFGTPLRYNDNKKPLSASYVGWGGIANSQAQRDAGVHAYAEVWWNHGQIDYSKGVRSVAIDAGTRTDGVWMYAGNNIDFSSGVTVAIRDQKSGILSDVDTSGRPDEEIGLSGWAYTPVNTAELARAIDNRGLKALRLNMAELARK